MATAGHSDACQGSTFPRGSLTHASCSPHEGTYPLYKQSSGLMGDQGERLNNRYAPFSRHQSHQCHRNISLVDRSMRLLSRIKPSTLKKYSCSVLLI